MDRKTLIEALSLVDGTPSKARLRKMDPEELASVANRVGVEAVTAAAAASHLEVRLDKLESELRDAGLVTNQPPESSLSFQARSTLGAGPGDSSRFEDGNASEDPRSTRSNLRRAARRAKGGGSLSFQAKSTLGCGPGDASRFEEDRPRHDAENEGGDGLGFKVRSTLGCGPGDSSRFDR